MSDLLALSMPWYEIVLRGALVYIVLLSFLRLSGKRTVGQFTPFDLLLLVLLGDAVQGAMIAEEESVSGAVILVATLLTLNWLAGFLSSRSRRLDHLLEGSPVLLVRNGTVYEQALRRSNLTRSELKESMRKQGCIRIEDVRLAVLESDGEISIVPREDPKT
ncbi:MAG TPA: YetF domain-containing protein [Lysobacter sp.]